MSPARFRKETRSLRLTVFLQVAQTETFNDQELLDCVKVTLAAGCDGRLKIAGVFRELVIHKAVKGRPRLLSIALLGAALALSGCSREVEKSECIDMERGGTYECPADE